MRRCDVFYVCVNVQDTTYAQDCNRHWCCTIQDAIKECRFFFNNHKHIPFLFIRKYQLHPDNLTQTIKYYKIYRNNMKRIVKQLYYKIEEIYDPQTETTTEMIRKYSIRSDDFLPNATNILGSDLRNIAENHLAHVTKNFPVSSYEEPI